MLIQSVDHHARNHSLMQSWHKWWAIVPIRVSETEVVVNDWVWRKATYFYNAERGYAINFHFSYAKWTNDNFAAADWKTNHYYRHPATSAISSADLVKFADPDYFPMTIQYTTIKTRSLWRRWKALLRATARRFRLTGPR